MVHPSSRARKARGYARGPTGAALQGLLSQVSRGPVKKLKAISRARPTEPTGARSCEPEHRRARVSGTETFRPFHSRPGRHCEANASEGTRPPTVDSRDRVIVRLAVNTRDNLVLTVSSGMASSVPSGLDRAQGALQKAAGVGSMVRSGSM